MKFSYNWLQSFFKKKLPAPKKLAELLTLHFAEVEGMKVNENKSSFSSFAIARVKEGKDFTLDIDVRPNRAGDCFSHLGIAREIAAILNFKLHPPISEPKEEKKIKAKDIVSVEVKHKWACSRYTARVITDVKVDSSPVWLKERLKTCGLRPINNIVDIANYVMLETGQPLHAFDGGKLEGNKIIIRFAKEKEKITTLDEQKFDLDPEILVIADEKKPVGIAGIKGGKIPEIDKKTKIVVLESANFNPQIIRQGSKKLNLKTDASLRFEHGVDPNLTEFAVNRAGLLIQKLAKGKVAKGTVDIYSKKVLPRRIRLDLNYLKSLLGIEIPKNKAIAILKKLGFNVQPSASGILTVIVPTFRLDVSIPEDLIEEIARIFGYDKIPSVFPIAALIPPKRNLDIFWEDISKNILKEAGFTESYNYSFVSEKDKNIFGGNNLIELENPLSQDFKYLRPSLIPNLLKNVQKNQKKFEKIKIFELGKIFRNNKGKPEEKRILTAVISGNEFYQLKGVTDTLLNKLGISNVWYAEHSAHLPERSEGREMNEVQRTTPRPAKRGSAYDEYQPTPEESKTSTWHLKKSAEIKVDNEEIGFLGEISPKILTDLKIEDKVCVFDLDFEKLSRLASEETIYRPISRFPAAIRDIAILTPRQVRVEEVLNEIETAGGEILRDVDLFDIYEGEELPGGKKNLAFHLIYQAKDRTLSSKEIDEIHNKIIKTLEKNPEWQVRK